MSNKTSLTWWLMALALPWGLFGASCTSVRPLPVPTDDSEARTQIEQRLHEILLAAETKDFERLESYHLYGPKFTRFSGSSPARLDATATRQLEHDGLAPIKGLKMRADALKIDVFGTVGIATFILDYSFDSGGETIRRKERSTLVFVKQDEAWKIAHEHLSPITVTEPAGVRAN